MVVSRQADVASVDSNVLAYATARNANLKKDVHVFSSIGPLPPYPIMVRSSLAAEEKKAICAALLQMQSEDVKLSPMRCFVTITKDAYLADRETRRSLANISASVRYY